MRLMFAVGEDVRRNTNHLFLGNRPKEEEMGTGNEGGGLRMKAFLSTQPKCMHNICPAHIYGIYMKVINIYLFIYYVLID